MKPKFNFSEALLVALLFLSCSSILKLNAEITWDFQVTFSSGSTASGSFESNGDPVDLSGAGTIDFDPGVLLSFTWDGIGDFETADFVGSTEYQNTRFRWDRNLQSVVSIWKGNPSVTGWVLQWGTGASGTDLYQLQLSGSPTIRDGDGLPDSGNPAEVGSIITLSITPQAAFDGTILHMRFEEGAGPETQDISQFAHTGSLFGDAAFNADIGCSYFPELDANNTYSMSFDGDFDAIVIPDTASLRPTGAITMEAFIKRDSSLLGGAIIGRQYGSSGIDAFRNTWQLGVGGNNLWFGVTDTNGASGTIIQTVNFDATEWHHLAAIWDTQQFFLYLDGNLIGSQVFAGTGILGYLTNNPVLIGADDDGVGIGAVAPFEGLIDEIRVTARALTPSEFLIPCVADTDQDGLTDSDEMTIGTDPFNPDTDYDGLLDGEEIILAQGSGCPDPLKADSDYDLLPDGEEYAVGTSLCDPDSDGDGVIDGEDPLPSIPGVTTEYLADDLELTAAEIVTLDPDVIAAPNSKAASGKVGALRNKVLEAQAAIEVGDFGIALDMLANVLKFVDGQPNPKDWLKPSPEQEALKQEVELLIDLILLL